MCKALRKGRKVVPSEYRCKPGMKRQNTLYQRHNKVPGLIAGNGFREVTCSCIPRIKPRLWLPLVEQWYPTQTVGEGLCHKIMNLEF